MAKYFAVPAGPGGPLTSSGKPITGLTPNSGF
jgi:hypothetical protein